MALMKNEHCTLVVPYELIYYQHQLHAQRDDPFSLDDDSILQETQSSGYISPSCRLYTNESSPFHMFKCCYKLFVPQQLEKASWSVLNSRPRASLLLLQDLGIGVVGDVVIQRATVVLSLMWLSKERRLGCFSLLVRRPLSKVRALSLLTVRDFIKADRPHCSRHWVNLCSYDKPPRISSAQSQPFTATWTKQMRHPSISRCLSSGFSVPFSKTSPVILSAGGMA